MDADTTRIDRGATQTYPPLRTRRLIARAIDSAIAFGLACLTVLPFTLNQASDALLAGGFDSFREFLTEWDPGTAPGGAIGSALEHLQPVVLGTIYLQALVIWAYESVSLTLTGSSIGKLITRVRVTRHSNFEPTVSPNLRAPRPWFQRLLQLGLRAGLVVGPPALAAGMLLAAAFAVPGAVDLAEMFIALSIVLFIVWLAGGVGLHELATGTRVVGFGWQEVRSEVEHQFQYHTGHADQYLQKLQQAARSPDVHGAVRSAEQRGRRDWDAVIEGLRSGNDATTVAARRLGEIYREKGLRGVLDAFTRSPRGPGRS